MILPILAYGQPVLKKKAKDIDPSYPEFSQLIHNMFETMYNANGVGLAAPQIGLSIRVFLVDTAPFATDDELSEAEVNELRLFKRIFVNPKIISETGDEWSFQEGCLSIPNIREHISRKSTIQIQYLNENFEEQRESFSGLIARVIQHEYDHIEGKLFTDKLSNFKKRLLKSKLEQISKGKITADYKMRFLS